ncbi:hypothetical protein BFW01_g8907 [Lasiodiplodia theobromae]|nr:hypothetical protein BFW01_g8907 [Lasiodiplodia theobromae]
MTTSIVDTDLAPVTTDGTNLYLYYQDAQGQIVETYSSDGKSWQKSSDPVATNARSSPASPITAYYVEHDANFSNKSTIHVFYFDTAKKLNDRVKDVSSSTWSDGKVPDDVATTPMEASRLTSGSFNSTEGWNPDGSQWVYFHQFTGKFEQLTEIRRTPKDPVHTEAILPEKPSDSLSDSTLAVSHYEGGINLFFQDHDRNVAYYANRNNKWQDSKIVIPAKDVEIETPMAAVRSPGSSGTQRLLLVDQGSPRQIQHYADEKLVGAVEQYYPGTRLGAVLLGSKVVLFYKPVNPAGSIRTKVYDGGDWKDGGEVVHAS